MHPLHFQSSWFDSFPFWLEYSPLKDAAFYLSCFLFKTPSKQSNCTAYTVDGFNCWRKVKNGRIVPSLIMGEMISTHLIKRLKNHVRIWWDNLSIYHRYLIVTFLKKLKITDYN